MTVGGVTDTAGATSAPFAIPNVPAYLGVRLYSQYFVLDAGANATGVSASNGGWMLIGT